MIVAVMGLALAANAQADQCKLSGGNGGYINAYVGSTHYMNKKTSTVTRYNIEIVTEPSVEQPSKGSLLCVVTYINKETGETESSTAQTISFAPNSSCENIVYLRNAASEIMSIEIWGAECKSVSTGRGW